MSTNAFVLKSIELVNWKTFANATLNLSESGITGISGKNGAGKSSFVDALLWCLYNYSPKDVTKKDLRRRGIDLAKELTSVKVTFTFSGRTIEVYRQMKGKNSTTTGEIFVNGEEATRVTGRTIEQWVTKNIHMDINGFKTAIVVPQKELDSLVDLTASERRASIEKLAGIEEMNVAIKDSREKANSLNKEIKLMPGSAEEAERAKMLYESTQEAREDLEKSLKGALATVSDRKLSLETAITESKESNDKLSKASQINQELNSLLAQHKFNTENVERIKNGISELEAKTSDVDPTKQDEYRNRYREVVNSQNELRLQYQNSISELKSAQLRFDNSQSQLANAQKAYRQAQDKVDSLVGSLNAVEVPENAVQVMSELEAALRDLNAARGRCESRSADMNESIQAMESLHGKAHCPTCQTELQDASKLVEKFIKIRDELTEELGKIQAEYSEKEAQFKEIRKSIKRIETLESEISSAQQYVKTYESQMQEAEEAFEEARKSLEEAPVLDENAMNQQMEALESERIDLYAAGEKVNQALENITKIKSMNDELEHLQNEINEIVDKGKKMRLVLQEFGDLETLSENVQLQNERIEILRSEYDNAVSRQSQLTSEYSRLQEREINAKENWEREHKTAQKKLDATEKLQKLSAVSDLLVEYREERIAKIAPEMSLTATDLISQMSNGRFIEVKVADDFGVEVVKDDDQTYSVAELSGGEKSIVALALRISIGALISNENSGLLWLDEVLPAQDVERRDAVLNVLRNLPIQQIVMINHTHEAEEVVNHVVRVNYREEGSEITYDNNASLKEKLEDANII